MEQLETDLLNKKCSEIVLALGLDLIEILCLKEWPDPAML